MASTNPTGNPVNKPSEKAPLGQTKDGSIVNPSPYIIPENADMPDDAKGLPLPPGVLPATVPIKGKPHPTTTTTTTTTTTKNK